MRRLIGLGMAVLVAAAGCGDGGDVDAATASTTVAATSATSTRATTTTIAPTTTRAAPTIEVVAGSGAVSVVPGVTLEQGDSITTGADGQAVLVTEDGTAIALSADTTVMIGELGATGDDTRTLLTLESGRVAAIRSGALSEGSSFEIQTEQFSAGLTGSGLGVEYLADGDSSEVGCLFGSCYLSADGARVPLSGGEWIDLSTGAVAVEAGFRARQRLIWSSLLESVRSAGVGIADCTCSERSLLCEGAVEVPFFPGCPDDTECECAGPDLNCADGRVFENDELCMASVVPLADLLVPELTATYDCIEAHTRWKVFDPPLLLSDVVLTPFENEASGCEHVATFTPVTYRLQVADDGTIAGMSEYEDFAFDVEVVDDPSLRTRQSVFGPRFGGGSFTIFGTTGSGDGNSSETSDAVMTQSGEETITVLGQSVRALRYTGTYTGSEEWVSDDGQTRATTSWEGTWTVWFDAVTGLELRSEQEAFFTDCSNCGGSFVGLRQVYALVELIETNQPLNPG